MIGQVRIQKMKRDVDAYEKNKGTFNEWRGYIC